MRTLSTLFALCMAITLSANVYLVGDACSAGWNADNAVPMTLHDGKYLWSGELNSGELKFITQLGEWSPCYNATENAQFFICNAPMDIVLNSDGSNDFKFFVFAGTYSLELDIAASTLTVSGTVNPVSYDKTSLMIVGDATPNGWIPTDMEPIGDNKFKYEGPLSADGGFKFRWASDWWPALVAPAPNTLLVAGTPSRIDYMPSAARDFTFKVPSNKSYLLTVDLDLLTISIADNVTNSLNNQAAEQSSISVVGKTIYLHNATTALLFTLQGQPLVSFTDNIEVQAGFYIVRVQMSDGQVKSHKVVVK